MDQDLDETTLLSGYVEDLASINAAQDSFECIQATRVLSLPVPSAVYGRSVSLSRMVAVHVMLWIPGSVPLFRVSGKADSVQYGRNLSGLTGYRSQEAWYTGEGKMSDGWRAAQGCTK